LIVLGIVGFCLSVGLLFAGGGVFLVFSGWEWYSVVQEQPPIQENRWEWECYEVQNIKPLL
jgi:hypothetical protein